MSPTSQITGKKPGVEFTMGRAGQLVLLVSSNGKSRGCLRLAEKNVLVGSSPDCTVCLRSSWVKNFQCQIIRGKHHTIIRNLSPETRLNDQLFTEAWLKPGDRISCGPIDINVLEVGCRNTEQPAVNGDEEFDVESGQRAVSYEDLQQLQRQAAELRQSLEQERERSDQRVKELEANLLASRDHLRFAREQLVALLGRRDQMKPKSESRLEAEPQADTGREVETSQPSATAQAGDDRSEATFDLQPAQSVEQPEHPAIAENDPAMAAKKIEYHQNFMAAEACCDVENFEAEDSQLELPGDAAESEEFCDEDHSSISGVSEMYAAFQIEYIDSFDEAECYESVEDFYEATDSVPDLADDPAPSEQTVPVKAELQAGDGDENTAETDIVAESRKAWFNSQSAPAGLKPELELPVDRDQPKRELPEDLMAIIRECELVASTVESESQSELVCLSADVESLQNDDLNDVAQAEASMSGHVHCEALLEQLEPPHTEQGRSLVGRILSLFGKVAKPSSIRAEDAEEALYIEPAVTSTETEDVKLTASEPLDFESPFNEGEDPCDEEFDLTADWESYQAEYQPPKADVKSETVPVCTYGSENTSLKASEEATMLDIGNDDELETSYEKVLGSLRTSSEEEAESASEVSRPSAIAYDEQVGSYEQIEQDLWQQFESDPHLDAKTKCATASLSDTDAQEAAGAISNEDVETHSPVMIVESKEEESIEDYMNKLLHRVGACRQSTNPVPRQVDFQDIAVVTQPVQQFPQPQDLLAKTFGQDLESRKKELGAVEISPKSLPALETNHFDEMRIMARESANSAIEASLRRKTSSQATVQLGIGCFLLVGGIVQTTLAKGLTSASALATIPCYVAAVYFLTKYFDWRRSFTSLDAKLKKGSVQKKQAEKNSNSPQPNDRLPAE